MKSTLLSLFLLISLSANASDSRIKSWKTLTNENGYTFKYPDCWTVRPDNPDEMDDPVTKARDIAIEEGMTCTRPLLYSPHLNILGFNAGWTKTPPRNEMLKEIENLAKRSKNNIATKFWLFFKRFEVDSNEAYVDVRVHKEVDYTWISWEMTLYCPKYEVVFGGPAIKNPDQSYIDHFNAGDIALPEPEKTIFESIHCTDSKK